MCFLLMITNCHAQTCFDSMNVRVIAGVAFGSNDDGAVTPIGNDDNETYFDPPTTIGCNGESIGDESHFIIREGKKAPNAPIDSEGNRPSFFPYSDDGINVVNALRVFEYSLSTGPVCGYEIKGNIISRDGSIATVDIKVYNECTPGDPACEVFVDNSSECTDGGDWKYYSDMDGTITNYLTEDADDVNASTTCTMEKMKAFQVGTGANMKTDYFGMSSWFCCSEKLAQNEKQCNHASYASDINLELVPLTSVEIFASGVPTNSPTAFPTDVPTPDPTRRLLTPAPTRSPMMEWPTESPTLSPSYCPSECNNVKSKDKKKNKKKNSKKNSKKDKKNRWN